MAERRPDPVRDDGLAVFVPALMGVGVLVSVVLVIADWTHDLLPSGRVRRRQEVATGAMGVVAGVAAAAGSGLVGPDFAMRDWRSRWAYLGGAAVSGSVGLAALYAGVGAFRREGGLFYHNGWMIALGVAAAVVLGLLAGQLLYFAILHRRSFRAAHVLVETTWFGRRKLPPTDPVEFARCLRLIQREG
jgi:hypothetical protein